MMLFKLAHTIFKALLLLLLLIVIPLLITILQVLIAIPRNSFPEDFYSTIIGRFFLPGVNLTGTLSILVAFSILFILTGLITAIGKQDITDQVLRKYLHDIAGKNSDLQPMGFSQQSAFISVSVPLNDIFIRLNATTDRPRFDLPTTQLKHLEEMRKHTKLTSEQREEEIQALRVVWYSQLGSDRLEIKQSHNIDVEYVIQQLTVKQPGAVILGSPGSGKSTAMRWLAYRMAQARRFSLWQQELNALPEKMAPVQIPILIRISDYAKVLSKEENKQVTFEDFFKQHYSKTPQLAERLLSELEKGRCLLLLDGLDEVASDVLRRRVAEQISDFVAHYSSEIAKGRRFNRFIITSRIVGYEGGTFANYAHYTLQDLADKQIEQFLDNWCPAVERYQQTFAQGMKKLSPQKSEQANKEGREQKERLWGALQHNPGIKRLATNPLMLTILALIQRSGKTLPHRRIELYQIITRTLLDNWNQEKGRRIFPPEEIPLAENMLSCLAYEMHSNDRLLTEAKVKEIAGHTMHDFFKQEPTEQRIQSFIDTLRNSSGLFIETGPGFFSFMHRTFQEYFTAQYLLSLPPDRLEQAIRTRSHKAIWREPLLLLVAYKSTQNTREQQQHASDLIQIILETYDEYDEFLQRNLLLAANCIVNCSAWSIRHDLQRSIANRIFEIYGDSLGEGRYTPLQKEIERIVLLWLKGQPLESDEAKPPFLDAWYDALCDASKQVRQEGAVHLLAILAPDLPQCPKTVLFILLPPLLQLADEIDMVSPPEHIRKQLAQTRAQAATLRVTEYALVALRLLDDAGPAGWLHKEWVQWNKEKPELLEQLTRHALELDYLLTPAALPANSNDPNWNEQSKIGKDWRKRAQRNPRALQSQLLQASTTARFPHAWLFKKLLVSEEAPGAQNVSWQVTWNRVLQEEMERGKSATYQPCLNLRLLLARSDEQQSRSIATELQAALSLYSRKQVLALNTMISIHLRDLRDLRDLLELRYLLDLREIRDIRAIREILAIIEIREIRDIIEIIDLRDIRDIRDLRELRDLRDLLDLLNYKSIIIELGSLLKQKNDAQISTVLLCIYSIITNNDEILSQHREELTHNLQEFVLPTQQQDTSTHEQRLLIKSINRVLGSTTTGTQTAIVTSLPSDTPDEKAKHIFAFQQQAALKKDDAEVLLKACTDIRQTTKETWQQLAEEDMAQYWSISGTVGNLAWKQLLQPWDMDVDARDVVIQNLDDDNAIICTAAALMLQHSKHFTEDERKMAGQKIMRILRDEDLSRRPLDPPERYSSKVWRLDDVLFETLGVLGE